MGAGVYFSVDARFVIVSLQDREPVSERFRSMLLDRKSDPESFQILSQFDLSGPELGLTRTYLLAQRGLSRAHLLAQRGLSRAYLLA